MSNQRLDLFKIHLKNFPIIAILRGVQPDEVCEVGELLYNRGLRIIEVPMNSPQPVKSIERLQAYFKKKALPFYDQPIIGAGTVTTPTQVTQLADIGCDLIISPHLDLDVMRTTLESSLLSLPGVCTPSEAFLALKEGAHALKFFPAVLCSPSYIKAIRAVLADDILVFPVGGVKLDQFSDYLKAGANGFGLGSLVYKKGDSLKQINQKMDHLLEAWGHITP